MLRLKKGAFDVSKDNGNVEVGVFKHAVEVTKNEKVDKIVTGEKVVVHDGSDFVRKIKIDNREKNEEWIVSNLEEDQEYLGEVEKKILLAKLDSLGVSSEDDVVIDKSLRDNTALILSHPLLLL